ncbi:MAG: BlaI/MecI/CopY family transcriptional regulator [Lachnospirales bacterium]
MIERRTNLTPREYEVMRILWDNNKPMLISDIVPLTKTISEKSIHSIINNLLLVGYVKVTGRVMVVKKPSRLYAPAVTLDEYAVIQSKEIYKSANSKLNLKSFLQCLVNKDKKNKDEIIKEIEEFLYEIKTENK